MMPLFFYIIWVKYFRWKRNYWLYFKGFAYHSAFLTLFFIFLLMKTYSSFLEVFYWNPTSFHAIYMVVPIPILTYLFLQAESRKKKFWYLFFLLLAVLGVLLGSQRVMWVVTLMVIPSTIGLYYLKDGFSAEAFRKIGIASLIAILAVVLLSIAVVQILDVNPFDIFARWNDFFENRDDSLIMRKYDMEHAFRLVEGNWLWGVGAGALTHSNSRGHFSFNFDHSYGQAIFTGGILMLIAMVMIYVTAFMTAWWVFRNSRKPEYQGVAIITMPIILGLALMGLTDLYIIAHYFIVLYSAPLAAVQVVREQMLLEMDREKQREASNAPVTS
jgi:hypothetical protein